MITLLSGTNYHRLQEELTGRLDALPESTEIVRVRADQVDAKELPQLLTGQSLFAPERVIVLRDASIDRSLWEKIGELLPDLSADTNLILVESAPDKRTKTYKWLHKSAEVLHFDELNEPQLAQWAQTEARRLGVNMEPEAARFLVHYLGTDHSLVASELRKLSLVGRSIDRSLIERHCEPTPQASAFEVIEAALNHKAAVVRQHLSSLQSLEDPYRFFGLLASQVGVVAACAVSEGRSPDQIAKECGVHPYSVKKSVPIARRLGREGARHLSEVLAECDSRIKSSRGEPWQLIEVALMKMSS